MTYKSEFSARILVLDDERLMRLAFSAKLKSIGYDPVAVGTVEEALVIVRAHHDELRAIVTDIMMGEMDGFVFRDIVRGIDSTIPIFFLTALDPEEGGGFLMRILDDPQSFYLPKSVKTDVLLKRIRQIVASRRIEQFIEYKNEEDRKSLDLAAHIQRSMLPPRALRTVRGFYTTLWLPKDVVSGDLYEAVPFGFGCYLYMLGDIQGHGTSAALAMSAVQSFLKTLERRDTAPSLSPADIANMLHRFFRANLEDVSYMTALICLHRPLLGEVEWISCGAPDLVVEDCGVRQVVNPEGKGGLPIGLMPDTVYSKNDVVITHVSPTALCAAYSDGLMDLSRDVEGIEKMPEDLLHQLSHEVGAGLREDGSVMAAPARFMSTCAAFGYNHADARRRRQDVPGDGRVVPRAGLGRRARRAADGRVRGEGDEHPRPRLRRPRPAARSREPAPAPARRRGGADGLGLRQRRAVDPRRRGRRGHGVRHGEPEHEQPRARTADGARALPRHPPHALQRAERNGLLRAVHARIVAVGRTLAPTTGNW